MGSSSPPEFSCTPLPELLLEIFKWCFRGETGGRCAVPCTETQLITIMRYSSEVQVDSVFNLRMYRKLRLNEDWQGRSNPQAYRRVLQLLESFLQDLGELFIVPKEMSDTDNTFTKYHLVGGFITFLSRLADPCGPALSRFPDFKNFVMELRFLGTIFGDSLFEAADPKHVRGILDEFEQVANEAGTLMHLVICFPDPVLEAANDAYGAFLEHIEFLKTNIIKFLDRLPNIEVAHMGTDSVDSLFIVDSLLLDLEDILNQDDNLLVEVKDLFEVFHQKLMLCKRLLVECTEIKEFMIKEQILEASAVAYDAEYLIKSFLMGDAPLWYLTIRLTHCIDSIKLNVTRLQEMKQRSDTVDLKVGDDFGALQPQPTKKDFLADDIFVEFDQRKEKVLAQLLNGPKDLQLIFIFGMAGIGKTTLAKNVYKHSSLRDHFDRSSWCVVSQVPQRKNILVNILVSISSGLKNDEIKVMKEEELELEIYQCLKERRYLIVVDDIWNSEVSNDLCRIFPNDRNGSRILFTSRNKDVAPSGSTINELSLFSNDQCWQLLEKMVFGDNPCPTPLHEIGKKIAANCYGLPLAVAVIAGVLSTVDKEKRAWETVGRSLDYHIHSNQSNSVMQILELSYKRLPFHLKQCFLYFGIFGEDEKIHVRILSQLWIAEGFICWEENKKAEYVAERYLMELIDRSLVIVTERRWDGGPKVCIIHDLVRDLCLAIAQKENFLQCFDDNKRYTRLSVYKKPLCQPSPNYLTPNNGTGSDFFSFPKPLLYALNMKLRRAWELHYDLWAYEQIDLALDDHVRYLSTTWVDEKRIPSFANLEFLIVGNNVNGSLSISSDVLKMVKLRYLYCCDISYSHCDIYPTSNLEYLAFLDIDCREDLKILKCFPNLQTLKCRVCDEALKCDEEDESMTCDFHFLTQLVSLDVSFFSNSVEGWSYVGYIKYPSNIRKLSLSFTAFSCENMATIGSLPHLEVLKLDFDAFDGGTWDTSNGEFLQLRILKLSFLDLIQWNVCSSEHFPKLQRLSLSYCEKLETIPIEIGEIETLEMIEVKGRCRKSLVDSATQIQEEQLEYGYELMVDVRNSEQLE